MKTASYLMDFAHFQQLPIICLSAEINLALAINTYIWRKKDIKFTVLISTNPTNCAQLESALIQLLFVNKAAVRNLECTIHVSLR